MDEVTAAKNIAKAFPQQLGFVNRTALRKSAKQKELEVIPNIGFAHFHHRRDEQTTIYEIAVYPEKQRLGWGRLLFYRVLASAIEAGQSNLFLKCPTESISNGFYQKLGFMCDRVDPGKKRPLNCWRYKIEVPLLFYCGGGGSSPYDVIAHEEGWRLGMRSGSGCNPRGHLEMVDNLFTKYTHHQHLELVKDTRPFIATALDVMTETQCRNNGQTYHPLEDILGWAREISQYCGRVILIPKYEFEIPNDLRCWLGYSIPTSHGGTPVSPEWFASQDLPVHLLGGSPDKQRRFSQTKMNVVSLDGNYAMLLAQRFGKSCWQGNNSGKHVVGGTYNAFRVSLRHQKDYWRNHANQYKQLSLF